MKKNFIIMTILTICSLQSSFAKRCPVTCQYISDAGIPVSGCAQSEGQAFGKLFANCTSAVSEVLEDVDYDKTEPAIAHTLKMQIVDLCTAAKNRNSAISCQDNARSDAFDKKWDDMFCKIRKRVYFMGAYLYHSEKPCGDKYLPDYSM